MTSRESLYQDIRGSITPSLDLNQRIQSIEVSREATGIKPHFG